MGYGYGDKRKFAHLWFSFVGTRPEVCKVRVRLVGTTSLEAGPTVGPVPTHLTAEEPDPASDPPVFCSSESDPTSDPKRKSSFTLFRSNAAQIEYWGLV